MTTHKKQTASDCRECEHIKDRCMMSIGKAPRNHYHKFEDKMEELSQEDKANMVDKTLPGISDRSFIYVLKTRCSEAFYFWILKKSQSWAQILRSCRMAMAPVTTSRTAGGKLLNEPTTHLAPLLHLSMGVL